MKLVEKGQCETLLADPSELPTLEELLDQFERIFTAKLVEDLRRVDHPACTARGTLPKS